MEAKCVIILDKNFLLKILVPKRHTNIYKILLRLLIDYTTRWYIVFKCNVLLRTFSYILIFCIVNFFHLDDKLELTGQVKKILLFS